MKLKKREDGAPQRPGPKAMNTGHTRYSSQPTAAFPRQSCPVPQQQYPQHPTIHQQQQQQQINYTTSTNPTWSPQPQITVTQTQTQSQMRYPQVQHPFRPGLAPIRQFPQPQPAQPPQPQIQQNTGTSFGGNGNSPSNGVVPKEQDIKRLLQLCKTSRGSATLLREALILARPENINGNGPDQGVIQEFLKRCRSSQEAICSQIPWATSEAERSRHNAYPGLRETREEHLLAELLSANEALLDAVKVYDDIEQLGAEQHADKRAQAEQKLRAFTAITSFTPTSAESSLVDQIFNMADTARTGAISSHAAIKIFSGSKLMPSTLADIWRIVNVEESNCLSRQLVGVAVRLIGHAQRSGTKKVDEGWVGLSGPPAEIDGLDNTDQGNAPAAGPSSTSRNLPPLTPEDRAKFLKIFTASNPINGVLDAYRACQVLMRSRLPERTLGEIWELADAQRRGYLDATSFVVAMYLVQATMSGKLKSMPSSLPSSIYFDASPLSPGGGPSSSIASPLSPTSSSFVQPQVHSFASSNSKSRRPLWDVPDDVRETAESFFDILDEDRGGYVEGKVARAHLLLSGLPEEDVKQIWSLIDINGDGKLGKDEFTVAFHLMQARQQGGLLPRALPEGLIPPTMRPAATNEASLIDLSEPSPSLYAPVLQPTFTGFSPPATNPVSSAFLSNTPTGPRPSLAHSIPPHSRTVSNPLPGRNTSEPMAGPSTTSRTPMPFMGGMSQPQLSPLSPSVTPSTRMGDPNPTISALSSASAPGSFSGSRSTAPWTWEISPTDKASSDRFFDMLDPWRHGYIEGETAVPFFSRSKLPDSVLAKIWDLVDTDTDGRLSKDDFARAMHLIKAKLAGQELPNTLPPSLTPTAIPNERVESNEVSPFDDSNEVTPPAPPTEPDPPVVTVSRRGSATERPLPPPPPPPRSPPPASDAILESLPDDEPRSQTPPPPYALLDESTTESAQ